MATNRLCNRKFVALFISVLLVSFIVYVDYIQQSNKHYFVELVCLKWNNMGELSYSNAQQASKLLVKQIILAQDAVTYIQATVAEQKLTGMASIIRNASQRKNVILKELKAFSDLFGVTQWRETEANELKLIIERKINRLQHPTNCRSVAKLVCPMDSPYGYASEMHDLLWCFVRGYFEKRIVIFDAANWLYANNNQQISHEQARQVWLELFQPEYTNCSTADSRANSIVDRTFNGQIPRQLMSWLPKSIGKRIVDLTDEPNAWWHGQFMGYILRPSLKLQNYIDETKANISYTHPVVGLHIRRSDKLAMESAFHSVEEYMFQVEDYFNSIDAPKNNQSRCVFVATDDPRVIDELKTKYMNYKFVSQEHVSATAEKQESRYSLESLWGVVTDIFLLAHSDFIVCTFSSNVGRLAYSLMLHRKPATIRGAHSLDVPFHYCCVRNPARVAIHGHTATSPDEWNLVANETVIVEKVRSAGSDWWDQAHYRPHFDGYVFGSNYNQTEYKKFPLYKTEPVIPLEED